MEVLEQWDSLTYGATYRLVADEDGEILIQVKRENNTWVTTVWDRYTIIPNDQIQDYDLNEIHIKYDPIQELDINAKVSG